MKTTDDGEKSSVAPPVIDDSVPRFLSVPGWERHRSWLWHGFSTRQRGVSRVYLANAEDGQGELNLGFTAADSAENIRENRRRFVRAVTGSGETPLRVVRQVHSNRSLVIDPNAEAIPEADGLMTSQPGILLGIQTADCVPVLVADPVGRVVAAFHAGWRGTVTRIVELGIAQMRQELGSEPADLVAGIGPAVGECCYAVGPEVQGRFKDEFAYAANLFTETEPGQKLNLIEANRRQLLAAGVRAESIAIAGGCTSCQTELYYSHRASGGHAGRMMAVIGIR